MPQTLLIVEEALRDLKAHWFEYIKTIVQAATAQNCSVEVACHQTADPAIQSAFSTFPIFRYARYLDNQSRKLPGERYYGFILHSIRSLRALWPLLRQREPYTHIFAPTILVHHLLAWWIILRFHPHRPQHLTLFFVANPGIWDPKRQTATLPRSLFMLRIQRSLLRLFQTQVRQGTVTLAVETQGAKQEFEALTGLNFQLFPHPVPSVPKFERPRAKQSSLLFACYGFARYEKGSDLLKTAVQHIVTQTALSSKFCIQWLDPFRLPDGSVCAPEALSLFPQVRIIDHPLLSDEYQTLLQQTHCMVLPYRNSSYHARVSRIAIEAACLGIPMIYTQGGWLEDVVQEYGVGMGIEDENLDDLIAAIFTMTENYDIFRQQAIDRQTKAQQYFSGATFCQCLLHQNLVTQTATVITRGAVS